MADTRSQLEEVDALIAATPGDHSLQQLRDDLLQLIELEEQETAEQAAPASTLGENSEAGAILQSGLDADSHALQSEPLGAGTVGGESSDQNPSNYTAQGTFMEHVVSKEAAVAEAPDLGSFQPVVSSSRSAAKHQTASKSDDAAGADANGANLKDDSANTTDATANATNQQPPEKKKKKKKKKKSDDAVIDSKFELPSHLVPLESDTPAQKLKKQRTGKALKSKFRAKQKEAEHSRRQNDWKSFATGGKRKKGGVESGSIFSTEEGVNARVGVISGGGGRKMTDFADPNKRHKFS